MAPFIVFRGWGSGFSPLKAMEGMTHCSCCYPSLILASHQIFQHWPLLMSSAKEEKRDRMQSLSNEGLHRPCECLPNLVLKHLYLFYRKPLSHCYCYCKFQRFVPAGLWQTDWLQVCSLVPWIYRKNIVIDSCSLDGSVVITSNRTKCYMVYNDPLIS